MGHCRSESSAELVQVFCVQALLNNVRPWIDGVPTRSNAGDSVSRLDSTLATRLGCSVVRAVFPGAAFSGFSTSVLADPSVRDRLRVLYGGPAFIHAVERGPEVVS